jgi:tripartite-type tricarboxylate transporter receptor subunit TctC
MSGFIPFLGASLATAALVLSGAAYAQAYPTKPVKVIVPFAPGSATDQIGRYFATKMSESLGQQFVVENRPGANGMIGAEAVAKAPADGYTILFGTNSTNAALKSLMKKLPYDQDTAFTPVGYEGAVPLVIAVNTDFPAKTLREFIAQSKAKPGQITFAYASTSQRIASEMLGSMADIKMNPVPYKAGPAAMTDLISGQVQMFAADFAVMMPQIKAGKVRPLAVTSLKRSPLLPDVPTVNEAGGFKDYELIAFFAVYAPAGTPRDIVLKLNGAINTAAKSKDLADKFSGIGLETAPGTPEDLGKRTAQETLKWAKAIKEAGIQAE